MRDLAEESRLWPEDPGLLEAYGKALEAAEAGEVRDAERRRASVVLAGLGLEGVSTDCPLGSLSGGERSRLALAALLVRRPRALLLDEPTNHLDDGALAFLEGYLRGTRVSWSSRATTASYSTPSVPASWTSTRRGRVDWAAPCAAGPRSPAAATPSTCGVRSGRAGSMSGGSSGPRSPTSRPPSPPPPAGSSTQGP